MILGPLLALTSAVATNVAFLLKYRGGEDRDQPPDREPLGILVLDEPIGSGPVQIGARSIAFCLVITGAALMPTQAEQLEPDERETRRGPASAGPLRTPDRLGGG